MKLRYNRPSVNPTRPTVVTTTNPELTLLLPCYNEADSVETVLREWIDCLEPRVPSFEIVAINDGSNDGTGRVLDNLRKEFKTLRVIHQLNLGASYAVRRGIEAARGNYLLVIEGEGRYEPSDFFRMWDLRLGHLLVLGTRSHRLERFFHRALSHLQATAIRWFFGVELRDISTPFRLIKRSAALAAMQAVPIDHVPVELAVPLYIARDRASDVAEVAIPHQPRKSLSRKRGIFSLTSRALGTLRGLFLFWIERPRLPMIPLLIQRRAAP